MCRTADPAGRTPRAFLLASLLATVALPLLASPPFEGRRPFRVYADEDGLVSPTPEVLFLDANGFLWLGTGDGLYRFDGRSFVRFDTQDGLPSASVTALHQRRDGRLYVGTRKGLARWDGVGFLELGTKNGLPDGAILPNGLASDEKGTLFVGTVRGLYLSIAEIFALDSRPDGPEVPVGALSIVPGGTLTFARQHVLYRREQGATREAGRALGLPPVDRIDATLTDRSGALWVRTSSQLFVLPKDGRAFVEAGRSLAPPAGVGNLALDGQGTLLVPTQKGLARRLSDGWRVLGAREGLEHESVVSAAVDKDGGLFLGLAGAGLARELGRGRFAVWDRSAGLPHDTVWAIVRDRGRDGALWVGTEGGLARLGSDGTFATARGGDPIYALAASPDGTVWAGAAPGGIFRVPPGGASPAPVPVKGRSPRETNVFALLAREGGEVWAGAYDGVYRLAPRAAAFERVALPDTVEGDAVFALGEDASGTLWGAGRFGLLRLTGAAARRFGRRAGLKSDFLASLLALPDGSLLVSYREALGPDRVRVDGDRLTVVPLDPSPSAASRRALFLGRDAAGAIWVGGFGIDVRPAEGAAPYRLGRSDGLASRDVTQNAFFADADGTVWFGTGRGLVRGAPGVGPPKGPLRVALTGVWAGTRPLPPDRPAELATDERDLRLSWSPLSFGAAESVRYRFRVDGFSSAPTETAATEVALGRLPAGSYRFEVEALPPPGRTAAAPATFSFTIAPSFVESLWMKLLVLALVAGGLTAVFQFRLKLLLAERDALRATLDEKAYAVETAAKQLDEARITDTLTGVRNRFFLTEAIAPEVDRAVRAHRPLAPAGERAGGGLLFLQVDLDQLKDLDIRHGNAAGDAVLVEAARRLKAIVRASDFLVRWDGAKFVVVTRSSQRESAHVVARKILDVIAGTPFTLASGVVHHQTCSVGWAPFPWLVEAPSEIAYEAVLAAAGLAADRARDDGGGRAIGFLPTASTGDRAEAARAALVDPFGASGSGELTVVATSAGEGPAQG